MVDVVFSLTEDGPAITTGLLDLGSGGYDGNNPDPVNLWIRHNGEDPITNAKLYIMPYSGSYSGILDPQTDYEEILEAGSTDNANYGRLQVSINGGAFVDVDRTYASSLSTSVLLGTIAAGASVKVTFKFIFWNEIDEEEELGLRQLDLRLTYAYTT